SGQVLKIDVLRKIQSVLEPAAHRVGRGQKAGKRLGTFRLQIESFQVVLVYVELPDWDKASQRPITRKKCGTNDDHPTKAERAKDHARKEIRQSDALKDSHPADMVHTFCQPAIKKESQEVEEEAAKEDPLQGGSFAVSFDHPGDRENEGCANDKHKQRKNEIVEGHPCPGFVIHLDIQKAQRPARPGFVER